MKSRFVVRVCRRGARAASDTVRSLFSSSGRFSQHSPHNTGYQVFLFGLSMRGPAVTGTIGVGLDSYEMGMVLVRARYKVPPGDCFTCNGGIEH